MVSRIVGENKTETIVYENAVQKTQPFRAVVLERAIACTMGDRQDTYGPPSGALSLAAEFMRLYRRSAGDKYCAAHDEAISLALLKLARIACGSVGHNDNYVDGAAYFAIAAECQHLHAVPEVPITKWCRENGLLNEDRLAEADKRYKTAIELEMEDKADRGMLNPYAPVNRKV